MTLMLPHLLDDLSGKVKHSNLVYVPGSQAALPEFMELVRQADKFQFGEIPLEENPEEIVVGRPVWRLPMITKVEHEAWDQKLIPLPAPLCWYEYLLGGEPTGLLIQEADDDVRIQRVDYNPRKRTGVFTGAWVTRLLNEDPILAHQLELTGGGTPHWRNVGQQYVAVGPRKVLDFIASAHEKGARIMELGADYYMTIYLTLMLSSLTTEVRTEIAPPKLNKARMKRGDEPLPNHRIVIIVPDRFVDRAPGQGGTHRSPRLHWRRTHKRHYERRTPGSVWAPSENHRGVTGWWVAVIARHLVGKKELGEVTHDYFVRDRPKEEV